jgi:hypothetical protein
MVSHRSRAIKPAMALWLLVLVADMAAAGNATTLVYVLAGIVAVALVAFEVYAVAAGRRALPAVARSHQRPAAAGARQRPAAAGARQRPHSSR